MQEDEWFEAKVRELNAELGHEAEPYLWRGALMCDYCGLPLYISGLTYSHIPPDPKNTRTVPGSDTGPVGGAHPG